MVCGEGCEGDRRPFHLSGAAGIGSRDSGKIVAGTKAAGIPEAIRNLV